MNIFFFSKNFNWLPLLRSINFLIFIHEIHLILKVFGEINSIEVTIIGIIYLSPSLLISVFNHKITNVATVYFNISSGLFQL